MNRDLAARRGLMTLRGVGWCCLLSVLALRAGGAEPAEARPNEKPPAEKPPQSTEASGKEADTSARPPVMFPTEQSIAAFEKRVAKNPRGVANYLVLGQLYLRQAKEKDDFASYIKAEAVFRKALEVEPADVGARLLLTRAYQAQHKFAETAAVAEKLLAADPKNLSALAILADAQMELGRYEEAGKAYQQLFEKSSLPPVLARQARWAELNGQPQQAIDAMRRAVEEGRQAGESDAGRVWYHWRLGMLYFSSGKLEEAAEQFRAGLKLADDDTPAMAGLAAVHAAQGRLSDAVTLYRQAVEISPEPPLLMALGDVLTQLGEKDQAKTLYDQAEAFMAAEAEAGGAEAHFREVARFYLDRDRQLPRALELAQKDLKLRQDIYAYDTLAWAYYKNDRLPEAAEAMGKALRLGTQDALLFYHAGMIQHRLGERKKSAEYLKQALAINPGFSLLHAGEARRTLAKNSEPAAASPSAQSR